VRRFQDTFRKRRISYKHLQESIDTMASRRHSYGSTADKTGEPIPYICPRQSAGAAY
jgi:hypothetical protein